ncbi:MAG: outer membrane beta-barrel protein [Pseudomonadota bacterium]
MSVKNTFLAAALLIPFGVCQAELFAEGSGLEGGSYVGVLGSVVDYEDDFGAEYDVEGVALQVGHEFGPYLALEGRVGVTNDDDQGWASFSMDYFAGLYLKGSLFLWDPRAKVYGLVGATHAKLTFETLGQSYGDTNTELAYGFGLEFYGNARNGISLEVMRYLDGSEDDVDYTVDAVSIGYLHRF